MKRLKRLIDEGKQNVLHLAIGSNLAIIGVMLLTHHRYFFWPPRPAWITNLENGSVVGLIGLCIGLGMIGWAMDEKHQNGLNRVLVATASAYYALLSATEFMHGLFAPAGVPNMLTSGFAELALLFITLYMAKISPGKEDDDY